MNHVNGRAGGASSRSSASLAAVNPGAAGRSAKAAAADLSPRRLDVILRALPDSEISSLISRLGIHVDPGKRIDVPSQVARALVGNPDIRDISRLPAASRELLLRIAEAGGALLVPQIPAGLETLLLRGLIFARKVERRIELVLPTAYLLQLRSWEGEDPRSLRALLAQAPFETLSAIAAHYLGRPATPPIALSLEAAWDSLNDRAQLAAEIDKLAPVERRLLEAIESVGGEVDTQELLDLEREPMRLRGVSGVTATRRGAGFSLERRAFLVPIHPNRHVIPTEIAELVGADRQRLRDTRRAQIRSFVLEEDHAPRRARFASDPAFLAVAMAFVVREPGTEVRAGVGTPRSLLVRLAQRFGRDVESVSLIAALSRAIGLWDPSAASLATPPGSLTVGDLTRMLFSAWQRGGAWDEARPESEVLRIAEQNRDASPISVLREMVLDALQDLGEGRWVPWSSLEGYLAADARIAGVERLLRRWAERVGIEAPSVAEVTRRIALETLPALGIIDLGMSPDALEDDPSLRLTPRGRALLARSRPTPDPTPSRFVDAHALRIMPSARVAHVLALACIAEIGRVDGELDLVLNAPSIARALSAGVDADMLRTRIEALTELPEAMSRMLEQASAVIGKASYAPASGFLWIDDPELRELLRTRRPAAELFVDPSPPAGLLITAEVDLERLIRRCRSLGVEIEVDGNTLRAGLTPPPGAIKGVSAESAHRSATRPRSRTPVPGRK